MYEMNTYVRYQKFVQSGHEVASLKKNLIRFRKMKIEEMLKKESVR